jgi:hypothetical protein
MADERDEAGEAERPVQPPVIDLEAEEVRAHEAAGASEASEAEVGTAASRPTWSRISPPGLLLAGLILLIIGAGSWAAFTLTPRVQPAATDSQLIQRLGTIESANQQMLMRIEEMTGLLNELQARPPQQQAESNPAEFDALKQQMSEIDGRINTLSDLLGGIETSLKTIEGGQGSQQKEIESTAQRIGEIQSQLSAEPVLQPATTDTTNALAAALVKLKAAASEGRPFPQELQTFSALAPGIAAAGSLQAHAASGVATVGNLSAKLQETLTVLKTPAEPVATESESGVWNSLKAKAASLISVRKIDDARWITAAEDARARLDEGNVALSVSAIRAVSGDPPPQLRAWLEAAEARLATDRALEDISAEVLKKLGGGA